MSVPADLAWMTTAQLRELAVRVAADPKARPEVVARTQQYIAAELAKPHRSAAGNTPSIQAGTGWYGRNRRRNR